MGSRKLRSRTNLDQDRVTSLHGFGYGGRMTDGQVIVWRLMGIRARRPGSVRLIYLKLILSKGRLRKHGADFRSLQWV